MLYQKQIKLDISSNLIDKFTELLKTNKSNLIAEISKKSISILDNAAIKEAGKALTGVDDVVNYISKNGKLPDNFITKSEVAKLGWDPKAGNLAEIAPGKSIGGDIFKNKGNSLPTAP